jgi:hypothetical protein
VSRKYHHTYDIAKGHSYLAISMPWIRSIVVQYVYRTRSSRLTQNITLINSPWLKKLGLPVAEFRQRYVLAIARHLFVSVPAAIVIWSAEVHDDGI